MKRAFLPTALAILLAALPAAAPPVKSIPARRGLVPCKPNETPATLTRGEQATTLNIPPRNHDPERPPEGWCGETAIQEAMLFHGAYYPQKQINAAGHPRHPDLYANEVPVALTNLGMDIRTLRDGDRRPDLDAFLAWLRKQLDAGVRQRPWAKTDLDEQRVWRVAEAQALSDYATGSLTGPYAEKRPEWARAAIERWQDILRRNPNAALRKEANQRIAALEKVLAGDSTDRK